VLRARAQGYGAKSIFCTSWPQVILTSSLARLRGGGCRVPGKCGAKCGPRWQSASPKARRSVRPRENCCCRLRRGTPCGLRSARGWAKPLTPDLFPYQHVGADFLAERTRAGLFDAPGLGKTAQAISAMDRLDLERGVIVCPASVRNVWPSEIRKFSDRPRRVLKGISNDDLNLWLRGRVDILVLSYDGATKWKKELARDVVDFVIFDEAHALKSFTSQRTRAALGSDCAGSQGYARWAAHTWFLTGTPMSNDPSDIWTWMRYCGATTLTMRNFATRYFVAIPGSFNSTYRPRRDTLPELKEIIQRYSLRRTLDDAGIDLPPLWITTQTIEGNTVEINRLLASVPGLDTAIVAALEKGGLGKLDEMTGHVTTLRRLVGEAKAPVFARQLVDELDAGLDKVVVFCAHRRPVEILSETLRHHGIKFVVIDGSVPDGKRKAAVDAFQDDPEVRVFIGNIVAAGTGLTLTAASQLVMLESDWTPANNAQALKRVHRIGQGRHTHVRFISLAKSIDEIVAESVARKTRAIAQVQGSEL
jgi:SWI/SNF-related matrix-associated actin-dependent regulator 1 of chromatin subfamily A